MGSQNAASRFAVAKGVRTYVQERLPDFTPDGTPTRLPEGNLNVVWRVPGAGRSVVLKYAPPYIASDPGTPLDPSRLTIEARCLGALGKKGRLANVWPPHIRAPQLLDVTTDPHVLIMEDVGERPTLRRWVRSTDPRRVREAAPVIGRRIGEFVGRLHRTTHGDAECEERFDNRPMQETRLAVQYQGVADMLRAGDVADAEALGQTAEALGEKLLSTGRCLIMGDLWPPSVLLEDGNRVRIIDWELAHYGRPMQDVAHWAAHLWMQRHRAPTDAAATAVEDLHRAFRTAYREALGKAVDALWCADEHRAAAVHFGAELLVRAVGPFQGGYVYDSLDPDHTAVQEAVTTAARHLRSPGAMDLFSS